MRESRRFQFRIVHLMGLVAAVAVVARFPILLAIVPTAIVYLLVVAVTVAIERRHAPNSRGETIAATGVVVFLLCGFGVLIALFAMSY
jgi:hypothetical protein